MRKLLCVLIALMLVFTIAAAESGAELVELAFPDFTIAVPADTIGTVASEIENNVPFFIFYQDYNPETAFNKSLNAVISLEMMDLAAMDAQAYGQSVVSMVAMQYGMMGIQVTDPKLLSAGLSDLEGREAMFCTYSMNMDYTGLGYDEQHLVSTMQAIVPIEGSGTYTFTLTTDDMQNIDLLMGIMNSISWKK